MSDGKALTTVTAMAMTVTAMAMKVKSAAAETAVADSAILRPTAVRVTFHVAIPGC